MNSHHKRYAPVEPPLPKRRRTSFPDVEMTDKHPLKLQSLPHEALKQILHHLHPSPCTPASLRIYYPLRTLCTSLRDAFDAHLTSIHLQSATPALLSRILPRFHSLTALTLVGAATRDHLMPHYRDFFEHSRARIRALTYTSNGVDAELPHLLAGYLAETLESLSTTSHVLLCALATPLSPLHTVELLMNDMDPACFPKFRSLSHVRLLYRGATWVSGAPLVTGLAQCRELRVVELRLHGASTRSFEFLPRLGRLRKLSLFGCVVDGEKRMKAVAACGELEELELEWIRELNGNDLRIIASGVGRRLRRLRICNCEDVDDRGLEQVATMCPRTEVELRFVREQFSMRVLMMFGERVSWGSYAL